MASSATRSRSSRRRPGRAAGRPGRRPCRRARRCRWGRRACGRRRRRSRSPAPGRRPAAWTTPWAPSSSTLAPTDWAAATDGRHRSLVAPVTLDIWVTATILRLRAEQALVGVHVERRRRPATGNELQHHALAFAQEVPGHQVGVVLHLADARSRRRLAQRQAEAGGHEVDGLGRALGEDDVGRPRAR